MGLMGSRRGCGAELWVEDAAAGAGGEVGAGVGLVEVGVEGTVVEVGVVGGGVAS